jgi:hypothetical protein
MNEKYFYDLTYTNFKICEDELIYRRLSENVEEITVVQDMLEGSTYLLEE